MTDYVYQVVLEDPYEEPSYLGGCGVYLTYEKAAKVARCWKVDRYNWFIGRGVSEDLAQEYSQDETRWVEVLTLPIL